MGTRERAEDISMCEYRLEVLPTCRWVVVELMANGLEIRTAVNVALVYGDRVDCCIVGETGVLVVVQDVVVLAAA
jgi:hypothetical protein